jgi:hypothetical protein
MFTRRSLLKKTIAIQSQTVATLIEAINSYIQSNTMKTTTRMLLTEF